MGGERPVFFGLEPEDLGREEQPKPETVLADEQLEAQLDISETDKPSVEIKSVPSKEHEQSQIDAEQQSASSTEEQY